MNDDRYTLGWANIRKFDGEEGGALQQALDDLAKIAPDLARYTVEYPFGDIYSRPGLEIKDRELINVAVLTALGRLPQLKLHIPGALNVGWTREQIVEVITQMSVYAGFPAALSAAFTAKEVFDEIDRQNSR